MSLSDDMLGYEDAAFAILKSIGAIACCDAHDDFWYNTGTLDTDQVYAYATASLRKTAAYERYSSPKMFHAAIKRILDNAGADSNCPFCEKAYNE